MEYTDYYAVELEDFGQIKSKLEKAKLTAMIDNEIMHEPADRWIIIEAPTITGFRVPGDFSTYDVFFDPWETLKSSFPKIVNLFIEEGLRDWSIRCGLNGEERLFEFYAELPPFSPSQGDQEYLSELFDQPYEELAAVLRPDSAHLFCALVAMPYAEMEMQDKMKGVIPPGTVIFSDQLE